MNNLLLWLLVDASRRIEKLWVVKTLFKFCNFILGRGALIIVRGLFVPSIDREEAFSLKELGLRFLGPLKFVSNIFTFRIISGIVLLMIMVYLMNLDSWILMLSLSHWSMFIELCAFEFTFESIIFNCWAFLALVLRIYDLYLI